jgi:hypothetical protein
MTIGEWLATRTPPPPAPLAERILAALGSAANDPASLAADRCVDAAERVVATLLHEGRTGRESAADLLAADALVTYAFEAASDDPVRLMERGRSAMTRLARLGCAGEPARG